MVDEKIENEKYSMDIVVPLSYKKITGKRIDFQCHSLVERWENYYFWKNASTISSAEEFSIFRWTFRNLDHFVNYSTIISDSINPAKTSSDSTDLTKRWVWSSYDIFSTQVEANRWYNILNMESEYNTYNQ